MGIRVGVIGAGIMAADHANTLQRKVSGARLDAVTDVDAWVDAVAAGAPSPLAPAGDGLAATMVAQAMISAMHDGGRWVAVPPADGRAVPPRAGRFADQSRAEPDRTPARARV